MGDSRKHHFVPQSYLRFFAKHNKNSNVYQILVYDKQSQKKYLSNVNDVAQLRDYNKVNNSPYLKYTTNMDPLYYEKKYTPLVEGNLPQVISSLTAICMVSVPSAKVLNKIIKEQLSRIISTQLLRTPNTREFINEIGFSSYKETMEDARALITNNIPKQRQNEFLCMLDRIQYTDELTKPIALEVITSEEHLEKYEQSLCNNHIWILYRNTTYKQIPFCTSDNPVILLNTINYKTGFRYNALEKPATVICFPLTPEYLVCLYHKGSLLSMGLNSYEDTCISLTNDSFVNHQNTLQLQNCKRQIYIHPIT